MIENAEKVAKLKALVLAHYGLVAKLCKKYKTKDKSRFNEEDLSKLNLIDEKIASLAKELKLTPKDKFKMLMDMI